MNNIKELRKQRDILQTKLALDLNLTQEAISSYETERVTPSADVLIKLADYFNTILIICYAVLNIIYLYQISSHLILMMNNLDY